MENQYNIVLKWGKPRFYYTYSYYSIEIQYSHITVFKTCRRQISISYSKYYESPFEMLRIQKMILWLLSCLKIILRSRTMNIINWKAYLRNSYHEYELARKLTTRSKNRNIHSWFFLKFVSECRSSAFFIFRLTS